MPNPPCPIGAIAGRVRGNAPWPMIVMAGGGRLGALLDLFSGLFSVARNPVHKSPRGGIAIRPRPRRGQGRLSLVAPPVAHPPRHRTVAAALPRCCGRPYRATRSCLRAGGQDGASQCECGDRCGGARARGRPDARLGAGRPAAGRAGHDHDPWLPLLPLQPRSRPARPYPVAHPPQGLLEGGQLAAPPAPRPPGRGSASASAGPRRAPCPASPRAPSMPDAAWAG
jgi:hypothetical protein